jgi:hypothetical protein
VKFHPSWSRSAQERICHSLLTCDGVCVNCKYCNTETLNYPFILSQPQLIPLAQ